MKIEFNIESFIFDLQDHINMNVSLNNFAKESSVHASIISRIINNKVKPNLNTFAKLCDFMQMEPNRYFNI
jgi:predicted transcriptional regulator